MGNYYLGLDVGIGSIGWAVINIEKKRIEDFNVRIFKSGEIQEKNRNSRASQQCRRSRGLRRLYRRKSHRKLRLKNYLSIIGLTTSEKIDYYYETADNNVIQLRNKGLSEKLTPEEIAACLIHICNNRGYKDFYEVNVEDIEDPDERNEYKEEHDSIVLISNLMNEGGYCTPAEMICNCREFDEPNSVYRKFHNSAASKNHYLITRHMLVKEVDLILENQSKYYGILDDKTIAKIKDIIFAQRDFEIGPGKNERFRRFTGYLDSIGKCQFFKDQERGSRFTVIADIYAFVNVLSQYTYTNNRGESVFDTSFANDLINSALKNGSMDKRELKAIAKSYHIDISDKNSDTSLTKCFKYIKVVKPLFEKYGYDWDKLIENYTDTDNNVLNRIGIVLSQAQTPKRRREKLKALNIGLDDGLINELTKLKLSGTANVSYKYMQGSIEAFCEGDLYGKYQAKFNKEIPDIDENAKPQKLPPFKNEDDCEFFKNPVVFRSINETRKLINAIIDKYGYPAAVNIETADELNKTFEDRAIDTKRNNDNQKENDRIVKEIIECIKCDEVHARHLIEKYKLWEAQEGKCLYSGETITKEDMLRDKDKLFEVDHIVPYSLILDNTINNKALVYAEENQKKGQRTPLMYMNEAQAADYRVRVNTMFKSKKCSKKKYQYLMLPDLNDQELLGGWRSRNLNDTRYICKYLVNYLRKNLRFDRSYESSDEDDLKIRDHYRVFPVKSRFTSMFRRWWLNEKTWGRYDKAELKKLTYLDHAADAIIIANCRPEYVVLAGEKLKLNKMYHQAGKRITPEYEQSKKACIDNLYKLFRMDRRTAEKLLSGHGRLTPIIPNLSEEVDKRLWDKNIYEQFWKDDKDKKSCEELYRENVASLYKGDPKFASSLSMPVISLKPDHKYRGTITGEEAIRVKEIDGKLIKLKRKSISEITAESINSIYTDDKILIDSLKTIFEQADYKDVGDYLKKTNQHFFTTSSGKRVNKVTVIEKVPSRWLRKEIDDNNFSLLNDSSYYCIELYKDSKGDNNLQGIAMSDIVHDRKTKKLYLKPDFNYPDDYYTHVMYLFPWDY
ncbi:type II CRISPR RNA-guided endonuclease Cas9 [Ruminococcus albus]|uniref:type II CRISPR RNA-guided endonuclease Cas9 n=1 Tax=Ruminococcus albus TaxID=1264 RepID=UPI001D144C00|nr:type II CRISPR RNA-guided endonuclease Cas9 [Ruminococcus albus]MCC3352917.1 type II CRISPR RNA-guided endonuclease Cas9 [Ruminococcus albus 8]